MKAIARGITDWFITAGQGWNRFWFTPALPHTLSAIRVLAGLMLVYTHIIWAVGLENFLGPHSWIPPAVARQTAAPFAWSHLWYIDSLPLLWAVHLAAIVVFALLTVGLFTRAVSIVAWLLAVSYCHRLDGALFGLDQVTTMLAMYLMIGPSGAAYSLDSWLRRRRRSEMPAVAPSAAANIAIRLLQLHMCIIYLFGGIGKMRGETWWLGNALWLSVANYEYQSIDVTWLVRYPLLTALITHVTVFWETFYCVLIWPRWTRPLTLVLAVVVHGGIALFLGMPTFGLAMLIGNLAFLSPTSIKYMLSGWGDRSLLRNQ